MKEKVIAIVFGGVFGEGYAWIAGIFSGIGGFSLHVISLLFFGTLGGIAGMFGKELVWPLLKPKIIKLFNKIKNKWKNS